jgi:hypothetical protein
MSDIQRLGVTTKLSNCELTRIDIDDEHYYFLGKEKDSFAVSLTHVLDIGAPFPEGLRNWLRNTDGEESMDYMMMTRDRGSKLHGALEELANGIQLDMAGYQTRYEKEAIVSFIRFMRFLQPINFKTELVVADPEMRVAGTLDFVGNADARRLDILLEPTKYLDIGEDGYFVLKDKYSDMLEGNVELVCKFVLDYKFTGRSSYNHKIQVRSYGHMYNNSYAKTDVAATRYFTWRYSSKHKNKFDLKESTFTWESFKRIYDTFIEYLDGFPEPPELIVYPDKVRLFEPGAVVGGVRFKK